jgi:site-specific DNA recombinase
MTTKTRHSKTTKPAHPATTGGEVRVAVYLRISTDEEHQPYSLEAREHRLGAYVASQPGWTLVRTFVDQASGATLERPALAQALTEARAGRYDLLLVYRVIGAGDRKRKPEHNNRPGTLTARGHGSGR